MLTGQVGRVPERPPPPFSEGGRPSSSKVGTIRIESCKGLTFWDFEVLRDPSLRQLPDGRLRDPTRDAFRGFEVLELSVRWYTVVYIPDVYIECLPRVS